MRLKHILAGATFALLTALPAAASTHGTLMGTVYDPKGLAVPGTRVTVRSQQSNLVRTVLANAEGEYVIALLPPGTYALAAEAPGFAHVVYKGITLNVDQVANVTRSSDHRRRNPQPSGQTPHALRMGRD
jgi:Carboxypeptidase regulatory-like domain